MKFGDSLVQKVNSINVVCMYYRCINHNFKIISQVDMSKVKLDVLKPWIGKKITEILGWEDDVVVEFVVNQLEEHKVIIYNYYLLLIQYLLLILF